MTGKSAASREENLVFRALYLIAIIFVVDGHTTLDDMFSMGNLFRYYSFHLMLFAFGAGYFFRMREGIAQDILSRAKRLLVPLYIWNVIYGVGAAFSALPIFLYQGAITLIAALFGAVISDGLIETLSFVGSALIFCVGVNLVKEKTFRVANMLPALLVPILWEIWCVLFS